MKHLTILSLLIAAGCSVSPPQSQGPGPYQVIMSPGYMMLLNTETGQMWSNASSDAHWTEFGPKAPSTQPAER